MKNTIDMNKIYLRDYVLINLLTYFNSTLLF